MGPRLGTQIFTILKREWLGLVIAVLAYLLAMLPPLMAVSGVPLVSSCKMGFLRYMVLRQSGAVHVRRCRSRWPLRWSFNLKYIVAIPEWFFNI